MTHVDPAALKPAITGTRLDPVTGPVSPAATVPPAWSCFRATALNLHPALADDPHDLYRSRRLLEIQTNRGKENWPRRACTVLRYSQTAPLSSRVLGVGDSGCHCSLCEDLVSPPKCLSDLWNKFSYLNSWCFKLQGPELELHQECMANTNNSIIHLLGQTVFNTQSLDWKGNYLYICCLFCKTGTQMWLIALKRSVLYSSSIHWCVYVLL